MNQENVFSKHLTFNSLRSGYEKLKQLLAEAGTAEDILVGCEATGHYWLTLFEKLTQDGFSVCVLNPLQVQSFRNERLRGSKTDHDDCQLIAKVLKFGVGRVSVLPDERRFKLKQLCRFRTDLVKQLSAVKLRILAVLDIVFPEYDAVFFDVFGVASTAVLRDYTTVDAIADLDLERLTQMLSDASHKRVGQRQPKSYSTMPESLSGYAMVWMRFPLSSNGWLRS